MCVFLCFGLQNCPTIQTKPIQNLKVSTVGIAKLLRELELFKAPGPDGIQNTVLKSCADNIAPILCMIFQRSLDTGRLPPDWLEANITAVFRKGDCHKAENYRPISLTSVPCKILEHIICHHIFCHLETHNFLTNLKLNHSFCTGYSCKAQLTTTVNDFVTSSETTQVDVAVLDFSEAFVVPHGKLLHKTPAVWH